MNNENISGFLKKNNGPSNALNKNVSRNTPNNIENIIQNYANKAKTNGNLNEDTEKFIRESAERMKQVARGYKSVQKMWDNTPLLIKVLNVGVSAFFVYMFTVWKYNIYLSIFFFIMSFIIIFLFNKMLAFIYLVLYIVFVTNSQNKNNKAYGKPIRQTNLNIFSPLDMTSTSSRIVINNNLLPNKNQMGNFSYSFWMNITGTSNSSGTNSTWNNYRYSEWKSIFYRGSQITDSTSLDGMTQFPGFWLTPKINNLVIAFQQSGHDVERVQIENIPLNKWVNVIVVVESKSVSVYLDGMLSTIVSLNQFAPDMQTYSLYVAGDSPLSVSDPQKSGYPGFLTEVVYYDYALSNEYIKMAFEYYAKIVANYQAKQDSQITYKTSPLLTSSDQY